MAVYRPFNNASISSTTVSSTFTPDLLPDRYGTVVVTHSGASKVPSFSAFLEGSFDNTNWFTVTNMLGSDNDYTYASQQSWCRIVPFAKYLRVRVVYSGSALTVNSWLFE